MKVAHTTVKTPGGMLVVVPGRHALEYGRVSTCNAFLTGNKLEPTGRYSPVQFRESKSP